MKKLVLIIALLALPGCASIVTFLDEQVQNSGSGAAYGLPKIAAFEQVRSEKREEKVLRGYKCHLNEHEKQLKNLEKQPEKTTISDCQFWKNPEIDHDIEILVYDERGRKLTGGASVFNPAP